MSILFIHIKYLKLLEGALITKYDEQRNIIYQKHSFFVWYILQHRDNQKVIKRKLYECVLAYSVSLLRSAWRWNTLIDLQ